MSEVTIKEIIDKHLNKWVATGLNHLPMSIEKEMADANQNEDEEWRIWLPIPSKVTDQEIKDFEDQIGYKLPDTYKIFLKHKHFYELQIWQASFCRHPVNIWRAAQVRMIFDGYPTEFLIDKGYIPFADWSDWGHLCFDTNQVSGDNNYPIVLWDHEIAEEVEKLYEDFFDLLIKLDLAEEEIVE
ncbi:SMI1/KNR4 family protein [Spirosoma litoris]